MPRRVYYAHCVSLYGTKQEERDMELLHTLFPDDEIYNPNNPECTEAYKQYGMEYFERLVRGFDIVTFRGLPNMLIPAGVWKEVETARNLMIPVIELPCYTSRQMTVDDTRFYLKEAGFR